MAAMLQGALRKHKHVGAGGDVAAALPPAKPDMSAMLGAALAKRGRAAGSAPNPMLAALGGGKASNVCCFYTSARWSMSY